MTQPAIIAGRYRVERSLGKGGMGTVWLCRDEQLQRDVAIKQIHAESSIDEHAVERARREARTIASIHHPNVVAIHDIIEDAGHLWLVMEYFPAKNLQEHVEERGPLDPTDVAHIGVQIATALSVAHARGVIHRDVKPANVLVHEDGTAKLVDFGIARTDAEDQLTMQGVMSGTPVYFSPELARTGEPDYPSDVWALGATLYAAVEGRAPYESAPTPVAMLHRIVAEEPRPMVRAGELAPAIEGMMMRDPAQRWGMGRVISELRGLDRPGQATVLFEGTPPLPADADRTEQLDRVDTDRTAMLPSAAAAPVMVPPQPAARPVAASRPPAPEEEDRSRRGAAGWIAAAVVFLVVAVGLAALWVLTQDDGSDPATTTDSVTTTTTVPTTEQTQAPTTPAEPTTTEPTTTTPSPTTTTPSPTTTTPPPTTTTPPPTTTEDPPPPPEEDDQGNGPGNGNDGNADGNANENGNGNGNANTGVNANSIGD